MLRWVRAPTRGRVSESASLGRVWTGVCIALHTSTHVTHYFNATVLVKESMKNVYEGPEATDWKEQVEITPFSE